MIYCTTVCVLCVYISKVRKHGLFFIIIFPDHRFAIEDFLEIMKNRQNRKLRKSWHQKTQMSQFKHCVKNILRENSHHHGILG